MTFRFFSPKNNYYRHLINWADIISDQEGDDDSRVDSGKADSDGGIALRLIMPLETLEERLEKLLRGIEELGGFAQSNFLEQLIIFLKKFPDLVNKVPRNFHSNALELVIRIRDDRTAKDLLELGANVRPENHHMLSNIKHLLPKKFNLNEVENDPKKPKRKI